jgi:hypothetical protein
MNFLQKFTSKKIDKVLIGAFVALGVLALFLDWGSQAPTTAAVPEAAEPVQVDTMIPAGYLLIPIQLTNGESLSSLSGAYALVDLFSVSEKGKKGFKVASAVKLVKAPLNAEQFAVLMKEEDSAKLVKMEGPFFAALKNPKDLAKPSTAATAVVRSLPLKISYGE